MRIVVLILSLFPCLLAAGQIQKGQNVATPQLVAGRIEENDTVPHVDLPEIVIMPPMNFKSERDYLRYSRLVRNIKITLPYARMAAAKLHEINTHMATLKTEKERKAYLKQSEKALFDEFEKPLRKLSISQGRLLIKLIDRETGDTSYNLIKHYKGKFSAFFWQSMARLFGSNLKDEFEEAGDDKTINYIITLLDNGLL